MSKAVSTRQHGTADRSKLAADMTAWTARNCIAQITGYRALQRAPTIGAEFLRMTPPFRIPARMMVVCTCLRSRICS